MPIERSAEEQARIDARSKQLTALAEEGNRLRAEGEARFSEPRFSRQEALHAANFSKLLLQNWNTRRTIKLDADAAREGEQWRCYSARDILKLALAAHLSEIGFQASKFNHIFEQLEDVFSKPSPYLAGNVGSYFTIAVSGEVDGPHLGPLDLDSLTEDKVILVRLSSIIRATLQRLGYASTYGSADDHREQLKTLAGSSE